MEDAKLSAVSKGGRISGSELVALVLERIGVECVFGVVGVPILEVADALQTVGKEGDSETGVPLKRARPIRFIGMRNEQSASYAASIMAYMSCSRTFPAVIPGVCLTVSGPGLVHALAGMSNAWSNLWPMIVLSGAPDQCSVTMGAFQEIDQLSLARAAGCVFVVRATSIHSVPCLIYHAFRMSIYSKSGPCFVELPADVLRDERSYDEIAALMGQEQEMYLQPIPAMPSLSVSCELVERTLKALLESRRPLLIIGKGSAFACAEQCLRRWVRRLGLPFLPMPMAKGVVCDSDEWCMSAARSLALKTSDLIILAGARLNWMLDFGRSSIFASDCRFVQIDRREECLHDTTRRGSIALLGDIRNTVELLDEQCEKRSIRLTIESSWLEKLRDCSKDHQRTLRRLCDETHSPLTYYQALSRIAAHIEPNAVWIVEGANTMDLSRLIVKHKSPRCRLDAGTSGTMGIGFGYAIGAALCYSGRQIVCLQGDSAFGFSGMEMETVMRYRLNILFIIINNNGIYRGINRDRFCQLHQAGSDDQPVILPPTSLLPHADYEKLAEAFGGTSFSATTLEQLERVLRHAKILTQAAIINVHIDPESRPYQVVSRHDEFDMASCLEPPLFFSKTRLSYSSTFLFSLVGAECVEISSSSQTLIDVQHSDVHLM